MMGAEEHPVLIAEALTLETFPRRAAVVFREGRVSSVEAAVGPGLPPRAAAARAAGAVEVSGGGDWLLPGWIDLQANDLEWLPGGLRSPAEHAARIREVLRRQAARGVTGILLTTMAAPVDEVAAYLEGITLVRAGGGALYQALLGGLVEGTFMNPDLHGAHNPRHVRPLDRALIDRFIATGGLRAINIAPETSPDSIEVIRDLARRGILVGCGHARPSGLLVREAVEAGLAYVIHLGNGPTGSSLKGFCEGGLLEEALRNDRLAVTLILDGIHIDRRLARDIIARKEPERIAGISDAAFAGGSPPGEFEVFGVRGRASKDRRYLEVVPPPGKPPPDPRASDTGSLFGSAAGMREVFENTLSWLSVEMEGTWRRRHPALPFIEALRAASSICSANPARLLGEGDRGRLAAGSRADAILARISGEPGAYRVEVRSAWIGGMPAGGQTP